ncbi:hypothetical protein BDW62DRAFT_205979 [Aspergillus aurantiobrunneus]
MPSANEPPKISYTIYPHPAAKPQPLRISYQIYVGIRPSTLTTEPHWAVIVRKPNKPADPGLGFIPDDPEGDCTWYHCLGSEWTETDPYRRVTSEPRRFDNPFFPRRIPVGMMGESQLKEFRRAFRKTRPQRPDSFVFDFLRRLVHAGILRGHQVVPLGKELCTAPGECESASDYESSPELGPTPVGSPVLFHMEL